MILLALSLAAAPHVFSLDTVKDGCAARVRDLATPGAKGERTLFTAKACPTNVLLSNTGALAIGVEGGAVKSFGFDGKVTEMAKLPAADAAIHLEENGKMRAAWVVTEGVKNKPVPAGAKAKAIVTFEGKDYPVDEDAVFPPWGTTGVAILAEHDGKGWKRIEVTPTKTDAGDTPHLDALKAQRKNKASVLAVDGLVMSMTCISGYHGKLACTPEAPAGARRELLKLDKDIENVGTLELDRGGGKNALAFNVMQGDTLHAFTPVILCTDGVASCKAPVVVEKKGEGQGRQLGIATQGGFTILSDEYSSSNARIVDATGKTVLSLPTSTAVVFLPDAFKLK